jgi:serine/threonine protein phosphatase 1
MSLRSMRRWLRRPASEPPATYVIGDIHGCLKPLEQLVKKIAPRATDRLIFVGDYIDRGPESRQVVDFLLRLPYRAVFLLGNHEYMLMQYLDGEGEEVYMMNGGDATLQSYGGRDRIPASHLAFFRSLKTFHEEAEFIVVHAGIRPQIAMERQRLEDLIWIRQEFIDFVGTYPKMVVFGHTPVRKVLIQKDRIGIDTGCFFGGKLTCLKLPQQDVIQVPGLNR